MKKDTQVGGTHYKEMAIQPIEYIQANDLGYCEGNVVKYISRWQNKGGLQDLEKARQYIDFLIEPLESKKCKYLLVSNLGLEDRTVSALNNANLIYTEDLLEYKMSDLQQLRGFGTKARHDIMNAINKGKITIKYESN